MEFEAGGGAIPYLKSMQTPPELERVVRRLLAPRRQDRYEKAEAVLADLRVLLGTISGLGTATGELAPLPRRSRRRWAAAALALVILGIGAAGGYWLRPDVGKGIPRPPAQPAASQLWILDAATGELRRVVAKDAVLGPAPDGRTILYLGETGEKSDARRLARDE